MLIILARTIMSAFACAFMAHFGMHFNLIGFYFN